MPTGADTSPSALDGCDLPPIRESGAEPPSIGTTSTTARLLGAPRFELGYSLTLVDRGPVDPPLLGVGALGEFEGPYSARDREPSRVILYDLPLKGPRTVEEAYSSYVETSDIDPVGEYSADVDFLSSADLSGDTVPDLMSAGGSNTFVLHAPFPRGTFSLVDEAATRLPNVGGHAITLGDWTGDGVVELGLGNQSLLERDANGATIYTTPLPANLNLRNGWLVEASVAGYDMDFMKQGNLSSGTFSVLVPDVTGDDRAEVLVSGEGWEDFAPFDGDLSSQSQGGFAFFEGGPIGELDETDARAVVYGVCGSVQDLLTPVGDVTGDGVPDVAQPASWVIANGRVTGAVWVVSRLRDAAGLQSMTQVSDAVVIGSATRALSLPNATRLPDVDGNGADELVVASIDTQRVYVFMGPVSGFLTLDDANLVIEQDEGQDKFGFGTSMLGGDLDLDGVADLAVGHFRSELGGHESGAVLVFSGTSLLAAMGR